jgi:hypothetical protein
MAALASLPAARLQCMLDEVKLLLSTTMVPQPYTVLVLFDIAYILSHSRGGYRPHTGWTDEWVQLVHGRIN